MLRIERIKCEQNLRTLAVAIVAKIYYHIIKEN